MGEWTAISEEELYAEIQKTEKDLDGSYMDFWQSIKIEPVKWTENSYGEEGGGFSIVAINGNNVIWYNDIEEGFNISEYSIYGEIGSYSCEQDELAWAVIKLFNYINLTQHD